MMINLHAAWIGFLLGAMAGAVTGLFFHRADWLGGYNAWPRRMVRLGHIAFFGIGLLNCAFACTVMVTAMPDHAALRWASVLLLIAAAGMPSVCYLSAWKPGFRHLFFIPATSAMLAIALVVWRLGAL